MRLYKFNDKLEARCNIVTNIKKTIQTILIVKTKVGLLEVSFCLACV